MKPEWGDFLLILLAYGLGSLPTGLWLGLAFRGIDIRLHGSKNIGATNTMRVLGKKLGAAALAGDMAKGLLAVLVVARFGAWVHLPLACGIAAIFGHTFSVFLKFRGGKGVATSAGVFLGLAPYAIVVAGIVFGLVLALTRMVSAGSVAAAVALAVSAFIFPLATPVQVTIVVVSALVIIKHRDNIRRILKGIENKI